jgi:arylsulfatase A-like enzyme
VLAVTIALATPTPTSAQVPKRASPDQLDRTVLPIPEPTRPPISELDARKVKAPPRFEVKAPAGVPNVVIILLDDIGFGHASTFGGAIEMPTLERLARNGLRYNQFQPKRIIAKRELRTQWHHVVDIAPTVMEAARLPFPRSVNGTVQRPFEGVSLLYTFDQAKAKSRHTTQYFEIIGNRAIYHDGWLAGTVHKAP